MKNIDYVTQEMYDKAIKTDYRIDFDITNNLWVSFGTVGLSLSKYTKRTVQEKHINSWKDKNIIEINKILNNLDWEKVI